MYLIYYNKEKAEEVISQIDAKEGVPKFQEGTQTMCRSISHPDQDKYALPVSHLTHRSYLSELFAQERVEELTEDWFKEEIR